jgi:hypothetical protein
MKSYNNGVPATFCGSEMSMIRESYKNGIQAFGIKFLRHNGGDLSNKKNEQKKK